MSGDASCFQLVWVLLTMLELCTRLILRSERWTDLIFYSHTILSVLVNQNGWQHFVTVNSPPSIKTARAPDEGPNRRPPQGSRKAAPNKRPPNNHSWFKGMPEATTPTEYPSRGLQRLFHLKAMAALQMGGGVYFWFWMMPQQSSFPRIYNPPQTKHILKFSPMEFAYNCIVVLNVGPTPILLFVSKEDLDVAVVCIQKGIVNQNGWNLFWRVETTNTTTFTHTNRVKHLILQVYIHIHFAQ